MSSPMLEAANPRQYLGGDAIIEVTIDGLNIASRRTAERAGRHRVLDLVFVAL